MLLQHSKYVYATRTTDNTVCHGIAASGEYVKIKVKRIVNKTVLMCYLTFTIQENGALQLFSINDETVEVYHKQHFSDVFEVSLLNDWLLKILAGFMMSTVKANLGYY